MKQVAARNPGDARALGDLGGAYMGMGQPAAGLEALRRAHALDPRGELYSEDNVRERLAIRNLMQDLRATGELIGGPAPFGQGDRQRFANHLDRLLTQRRRPAPGV